MKALLLVDIQNGFCPGGNLPVPDGDQGGAGRKRLIDSGRYDLIVASQDWHPPGHGSFASSHPGKQPFEMGELSGKPQMLWPDHCVQDTLRRGTASRPEIRRDRPHPAEGRGSAGRQLFRLPRQRPECLDRPFRFPSRPGRHRTRRLRSRDRLLREVLRARRAGHDAGRQGSLHRGRKPRHHTGRRFRRNRRDARARHRNHRQPQGSR